MSIQRWGSDFGPVKGCRIIPHDHGEFVTYVDHVAAVAEAEQRVGKTAHVLIVEGYRQGYAAALDAAREAVAGLPTVNGLSNKSVALAAIDALKEKP